MLSPASVEVPNTDWCEPVLLWMTVCMPTGSGKSTLFKHIYNLLQLTRELCGQDERDPVWAIDDATFEKMGVLMSRNSARLLGLYDELAAFLTQINLYRGRGLSDSHELSLFLQLFNGHPWRRDTGIPLSVGVCFCSHFHSFRWLCTPTCKPYFHLMSAKDRNMCVTADVCTDC